MLRRVFLWGIVLAVTLAGLTPAQSAEDMRTASDFLQGLRERGYFDLASEFLEELRANKDTPADIKATIDYEQGRLLLEEAAKTGDLVRRKELLDQARGKIAAFVAQNAKHKAAPEAAVQLARLLVERGHLAMLNAGELDEKEKAEKAAKLKEARTSFDEAREAYSKAEAQLEAAFKTFPNFIPEGDPRKDERDRTQNALMDTQLQKVLVEYEEGETYDLGSKERNEYLAKGLTQFEELYKKYRTQMAGLAARMWQAKCYEESGELGKAMGLYNELLRARRQSAPRAPAARRLFQDHRRAQARAICSGRRRLQSMADALQLAGRTPLARRLGRFARKGEEHPGANPDRPERQ